MGQNIHKQQDCMTVAEVNVLINATLETYISKLQFEGEISEITYAKSGHLYLTIKDETSSLSAVMWKGSVLGLKFKPTVGMSVICTGKPNVYSANGRMQIVLSQMFLAGEGLLQAKFKALFERLSKEGLFEPNRKRAIPKFPLSVGIVTSKTGAVIHDIMIRIKERMPIVKVYLYDCRVQGPGSVDEITAGIEYFNNYSQNQLEKVDVLIVGRGGGSLEDLWSFNEEKVVRAIFASTIPIISSVGHEVDTCLSDLAADARAPTPTAAAEMITMVKSDLMSQIEKFQERLNNYENYFGNLFRRVDEIDLRLTNALNANINKFYDICEKFELKIKLLHPSNVIKNYYELLTKLSDKLKVVQTYNLKNYRNNLENLNRTLESLNPKSVLSRGFGILRDSSGVIVTSINDVSINDSISIEMQNGILEGVINGKAKRK